MISVYQVTYPSNSVGQAVVHQVSAISYRIIHYVMPLTKLAAISTKSIPVSNETFRWDLDWRAPVHCFPDTFHNLLNFWQFHFRNFSAIRYPTQITVPQYSILYYFKRHKNVSMYLDRRNPNSRSTRNWLRNTIWINMKKNHCCFRRIRYSLQDRTLEKFFKVVFCQKKWWREAS